MTSVTARAHINIALIKYWGKKNAKLNIPDCGSLSLTLDKFYTTTKITLKQNENKLYINGNIADKLSYRRVFTFIEHIKKIANKDDMCEIHSNNSGPTAAGLASSASGFAALAVAAAKAYGLNLNKTQLSALARRGSASAARSIFGGFSIINATNINHDDSCFAEAIATDKTDNYAMIIAICSSRKKDFSSTNAMNHSKETSPYYHAWIQSHSNDLSEAKTALKENDFTTLGNLMEHSTLKMHACLMAAAPGAWYFAPTSIDIMNKVKYLRERGLECYFTLDAGPNVKILCKNYDVDIILSKIKDIAGVEQTIVAGAGPEAKIIEND